MKTTKQLYDEKVVITLSIVAAVLLGVLVFVWVSKHKLVKDLNLEKEDLTTELVALQNDYATLTSTNQAINDSLAVEREKVGQLIERLQKTEATNRSKIRQYEKELGTLRSIMKGYIVQIDSLNTLNALRQQASEARQEAEESRKQYDELVTTTEALSAKASAGAIVKARELSFQPSMPPTKRLTAAVV